MFDETSIGSIWIEIIYLGLVALFWYLIARRANNIFKWIYVVLAFIAAGLYGLFVIISAFELQLFGNNLPEISLAELTLGCVINILSVGAAICLFFNPSRIWFESKGRVVNDEDHLVDVFE